MDSDIEEQQRVLSEVSHDLANRFHRSYYFLDLLAETLGPGRRDEEELLDRMRGTVEDIEAMARGALELVRPIELQRLRVSVADLMASLRQHVGIRALELRGDPGISRSEVSVDPARISSSLACLCRAVLGGDASEAPLVVELAGGDFVSLRLHPAPSAVKPGPADLQLALAARVVRLHGGALEIEDGDSWSLKLSLPTAGEGA